MKKFNIGDVVVIKNEGKVFKLYQEWADLLDLKNFKKDKVPNKDAVVKVTCVGYHSGCMGLILYGVTDGKNDYIISEAGLEKHVEYEWQWLVKYQSSLGWWYDTTYYFKTKEELESTTPKSVVIVSRIEESKREVVR